MSNTLQDAESAVNASEAKLQPVRDSEYSEREPAQFVAGGTTPAKSNRGGLQNNPDFRHFAKFCIVGASSTAVMFCVLNLCKYGLKLPLFASLTAAFLLSCCNGFYWNRRWTFKAARGNSSQEQSFKFFAVNLVGFLLNTSIVVLIVAHFTARGGLLGSSAELSRVLYNILAGDKHAYSGLLVNGSEAFATCIVVSWNYFANRLWTFKH